MNNYVITIARGFGSGGKEIAIKLSAELGIPCYEEQILKMASEKSGVNEILFQKVDEKLTGNYITKALKQIPVSGVVKPSDKRFVSDINLFNIQAQIIEELARTESCIIIGKCADYILGNKKNVIKIYIEAPRSACINSIMNKLHINQEEAEKLIIKTDKYRGDYYKYYTGGRQWTNPVNYDMVLNSERIGRDKCVKLIKDYIGLQMNLL